MKKLVIAPRACARRLRRPAPDPQAPKVKITPLGSHDGEFCPLDGRSCSRIPDGTRILYDPAARCAARTTRASAGSTRCC